MGADASAVRRRGAARVRNAARRDLATTAGNVRNATGLSAATCIHRTARYRCTGKSRIAAKTLRAAESGSTANTRRTPNVSRQLSSRFGQAPAAVTAATRGQRDGPTPKCNCLSTVRSSLPLHSRYSSHDLVRRPHVSLQRGLRPFSHGNQGVSTASLKLLPIPTP